MAEAQLTTPSTNPFTWLPAGWQAGILIVQASAAPIPDVTVSTVMVEDFGQLAQGEELGDSGPSLELPIGLFATGPEES